MTLIEKDVASLIAPASMKIYSGGDVASEVLAN